jgi:hypothetical protein
MIFSKLLLSFLLCFCISLALFAQTSQNPPSGVDDFPDQGFPKMTGEKYSSLEKEFFIYAVLEGLPQWYTEEHHNRLIQKLRPEIKELYFWSFLDGQVSNGGFMQFFENRFGYMVPDIKKFYRQIGDLEGLETLEKAEEWAKGLTDESWIDDETNQLDQAYFDHMNDSRGLIESYIRANSGLFVRNERGEQFPPYNLKKIK